MKLNEIKKQKILNGELAIIEHKNNEKTEIIEVEPWEFRELVGYQSNVDIMSDCITLLDGNQLNYECDGLYKLVYGQKLVIDTFKEYAGYFIDAVNESFFEDFE